MKAIRLLVITFFLLNVSYSDLGAQQLSDEERLYYYINVENTSAASNLARNIENPNYVDIYDQSLLMHASARGLLPVCKILLRGGADPDMQAIDGVTAGMYAAYNGHTRIVKLLLEKGISVDIQSVDGFTALMIASQNGHNDIVRLFLEKGANLNLQASDGYT
ncbi:MAG TPA: ankyrin repeat domain-containing protein, partial [Bacteroidales bacterium]|nr:ankyrin repeat domain-containing protein [Bacteroidales bacterium]